MKKNMPTKRTTKLLAMCTAALLLCSCANPAPVPPAGEPPADVVHVLSADPFAHQLQLAEKVLAFPGALAALENAGWQTAASPGELFDPGQYARIPYTKENACVTAVVGNVGDSRLTLAECQLVGLAATMADGAAISLAGGVSLGATQADVWALWGVPDGGRTAVGQDVLRYTTGQNSYYEFIFDNSILVGVEVFHFSAKASPEVAALPAEALAYQPPAQLEDDWQSFTLDYAGGRYTLPAPVAAFAANGWLLLDEGSLAPGGWVLGVRLRRGNQILHTRLENPGGETIYHAGGFVTLVESSPLGADVSLRLSGGVSELSSREEIATLMGPPHATQETSNALTYTYRGGGGFVEFHFEPTAHTLLSMKASRAIQP